MRVIRLYRILSVALAIILAVTSFPLQAAANDKTVSERAEEAINQALERIEKDYTNLTPWSVMSFIKADAAFDSEKAKEVLLSQVAELTSDNTSEHYAVYALALTALGVDSTAVKLDERRVNLFRELIKRYDSEPRSPVSLAYSLLAFDSFGYAFPYDGISYRDYIIPLLEMQVTGGGYALTGNEYDTGATAVVLCALSPYYQDKRYVNNKEVTKIVENCVKILSAKQTESGGFTTRGKENSGAAAMVAIALTTLGIDPETDPRFVKEQGIISNILNYQTKDGGFANAIGGESSTVSTEQAIMALSSYAAYKSGGSGYFVADGFVDMQDASPFAIDIIKKAKRAAIIKGSNGRFNPNYYVTNTDIAIMLLRANGITEDAGLWELCIHETFYHIVETSYADTSSKEYATMSEIIKKNLGQGTIESFQPFDSFAKNFPPEFVASFKDKYPFDYSKQLTREMAAAAIAEYYLQSAGESE